MDFRVDTKYNLSQDLVMYTVLTKQLDKFVPVSILIGHSQYCLPAYPSSTFRTQVGIPL